MSTRTSTWIAAFWILLAAICGRGVAADKLLVPAIDCPWASAQQAGVTRLPIEVWRAAPRQMIEFCLPLAPGELTDPARVRVANAQTQVSVLSTWPMDHSLRALWVRAIPHDAGNTLQLEYGPGVTPIADRGARKMAQQESDSVVITAGPLRIRIAKDLKPLDQVWLDADGDGRFSDGEAILAGAGSSPVLTTLDGRSYAPAGATKVAIEECGPVCTVVRIEGELAPADRRDAPAEQRFQIVYRVKAWLGSAAVEIQHILKRRGAVFLMPMPTEEVVKHESALLVPIDSYGFELKLRRDAAAVAFLAGGAGKTVDEGTLIPGGKRAIIAGGQFGAARPDVRFAADGPRTPGALEWLDAGAGKCGVTLAVRDAAAIFPKAYELDGMGSVRLDLWKDDPTRAALEIGSGFFRAHDIILMFHVGAATAEHGQAAAVLSNPARASVPVEQLRTSGVFGPLPARLDKCPEFAELQKTLVGREPLGISRFGDQVYGKNTPGGLTPQGRVEANGLWFNPLGVLGGLYAATGERDYLEDVDRTGRWERDWYVKHKLLADGRILGLSADLSNTLVNYLASNDKSPFAGHKEVGQALKAGKRILGVIGPGNWCRGGACWRNKELHLDGLIEHWLLTGDPTSKEAACDVAEFFYEIGTSPKAFGNPRHEYYTQGLGHRFHVPGRIMLNLLHAYEALGEEKYLAAAQQMMGFLLDAARKNWETRHEEFPRDDQRYRLGTSMMSWPRQHTNWAHAAWIYLRYKHDPLVREYVDKLGTFLVNERWDPERREFWKGVHTNDVGQDTIVKGRIYLGSHQLQTASCLGWCYLVTGKEQYRDVARQAYLRACEQIREMKTAGKSSYDVNAGNHLEGFQGLLEALSR